MTLDETLQQLEALGDAKVRAHNTKYGAGDDQFGVKHGDLRVLAKKIKTNHELALSLWETGNVDAACGNRIHFPELRKRAIAIGETLGIYRDYPVSKGCTSPFARIWIHAMVSRQGSTNTA